MPNTVRVYPDGDVWVVKRDGVNRAAAIRNTQKEAYEVAREIALNQGLTVTVHSPAGKIQRVINPKDRSSGGEGCFITTACVNYYGLCDNCEQLEILRQFRDGFLLKSAANKKLVKKYYRIAPRLARLMENDKNKYFLFKQVFLKINSACAAIKRERNEEAKAIYTEAIQFLVNYFED